MNEIKFTEYTTVEGDRWDLIARKAYGDSTRIFELVYDNPGVAISTVLPVGKKLYVRVYTDPETGETLPPWLSGENGEDSGTGEVDPSIPIVVVPPPPLSFSAGFPRVSGNKIEISINRSETHPFTVKRIGGGVVASSSSYLFTVGFPILTPDLVDGDLYVVEVGPLTSEPLTVVGSGIPMVFSSIPVFLRIGSVLNVRYVINKTGDYRVKITNRDTSAVVYNTPVRHASGDVVTIPVPSEGKYLIEVGELSAFVDVFNIEEVTAAPDWLTNLGLSYSVTGRYCSLWVGALYDVEVMVERVDGQNIAGLSWGGVPWRNGEYIPGTTEYTVDPYTEVFRMNPIADNTGGIVGGVAHRVRIRRENAPGQVFVIVITAPLTNQLSPVPIEIATAGGNACKRGPFIFGTITPSAGRIGFSFDAEDVDAFKWRIKESGVTVRSGTQLMRSSNGTPVFNPSNAPYITFDELEPGNYLFEIEGHSCTSAVSSQAFTVIGEDIPPVVEGDITPKTATMGFTDHMNIIISGSSENWVLNDTGTHPRRDGYDWEYQLGGHIVRQAGRLVNYPYQSNAPLRVNLAMIRQDLPDLSGWDGTDPSNVHGWGFSRNTSVAFKCLVFNEIE